MHLHFLRHGIAHELSAKYPKDADRPLTDEGKEKLDAICKGFQNLEVPPWDFIVTSPYRRAQETAAIFAEFFKSTDRVVECAAITPSLHFEAFQSFLMKKSGQSFLIVGHEPSLSSLISILIQGTEDSSILLKKGGMASVECSDNLSPGSGHLEWLMQPAQIKRLG